MRTHINVARLHLQRRAGDLHRYVRAELKQYGSFLGPGLVTGAADDDPSGIATYSQAGAQFGFGMLWSLLLTYPLMVSIQLVSARIGCATGQGLAASLKRRFPRWLLIVLVALLTGANILNIAADLAAMGDALQLAIGGDDHAYTVIFGMGSLLLQIFIPYRRYARVMKWLTLVLFAYVVAALTAHIDWWAAAQALVVPHMPLTRDAVLMVVAIFGTTISPYLFFWQASQEVEELNLRGVTVATTGELRRIKIDTVTGMGFSNIIALFIMLTTAATLHAAGITTIDTSTQAAQALRPLTGDLAFALFALGIIGTGLLAVPVLAGSAAYAIADTIGWGSSLEARPLQARGFYAAIAIATLLGVTLSFAPIEPIKLLFWSAVANGVVAVPIMAMMMVLAGSRKIMGEMVVGRALAWGGWAATGVMLAAVLALGVLSI